MGLCQVKIEKTHIIIDKPIVMEKQVSGRILLFQFKIFIIKASLIYTGNCCLERLFPRKDNGQPQMLILAKLVVKPY